MMLIFATTALALAAIGIYGVIAYAAEQRQPEFATRMALGAQRPQIVSLMMLSEQRPAWAGLAAGLIVDYAAGRLVSSSVYGMTADDPLVLLMASAAVGVVTVVATAVPAKATQDDQKGNVGPPWRFGGERWGTASELYRASAWRLRHSTGLRCRQNDRVIGWPS